MLGRAEQRLGAKVPVRVLRADHASEETFVAGQRLMGNVEQLVVAIGPVLALILASLGLQVLLPFAHKLGPFGMRAYRGGMHHRSAIYAALLSPTRILGDWLNRPPVTDDAKGGPLVAIGVVLVVATLIAAYVVGGGTYVLWTLGAIALAVPLVAVLYVNLRR